MESNDSPEIPDRGETSDIPGLPSGRQEEEEGQNSRVHDDTVQKNVFHAFRHPLLSHTYAYT